MMVNNISNQTVHHQSTTKFASMLQDVKKLPACKTSKYLLHFWYCTKKSIINIFNHVFTDWVIISLLNTYVEKILKLGNRMWRQTSDWVTCAKPSKRNTDPDVSHTFSRRFSNKTTQNALAMLYRKFLRKKNIIIRCFVWIYDLPEIGCPVMEVENLYCQFFSYFTEPILADF